MNLFDTHCHLDDEQFRDDRDGVVNRAIHAGVKTIIAVGTTLESSRFCVELASKYAPVLAAVGIQPNYCAQAESSDWDGIVALSRQPGTVALGETGLDRYWDHTPLEVQQDFFDRHLRLSQETGLPFIVHLRDCDEDILVMLREARSRGLLRGVMHSFTGSLATMQECLELGLYISFAGMVTYKKSDELRRLAAAVPEDRIVIETDAPYLSPHPKRGQRPNEPSLLVHTAECLAAARNQTRDALAEYTTANARTLFGVARKPD